MATSSKKAVKIDRITDDMKFRALKKKADLPFRDGSMKAKKAAAVLAASGKTVGDAKQSKLIDSYAIRELAELKFISLVKSAA